MELKDLLGASYREDLSLAEIEQLLSEMPEEKTVPKAVYDKTASELSEYKKKSKEAAKKASTIEEQFEEMRAETEALKAEMLRDRARLHAKEKLMDAGVDLSDKEDLLESLVDTDLEKTQARLNGVLALLESETKRSVDKAKQELIKSTPSIEEGVTHQGLGKSDFVKMSLEERLNLYKENPSLYETLTKEE